MKKELSRLDTKVNELVATIQKLPPEVRIGGMLSIPTIYTIHKCFSYTGKYKVPFGQSALCFSF